ncbi:hypothetical protein [Thermus islandicus]|uniref:hypothetical protein n=1 Tax=Thermus islandicus TaxID=540988 RepID=UPI0003B37682|nr:hypothetical protein [Thermus islandicus]
MWLLLLLLKVASLAPALGQDWGLTQSQTLTAGGAKAWRYTLSPRGEEARALWEALSLQYRDHLRAGYRVDLGGWRLYFLGGKLRLERHCQAVNPACFTFGALPVDKARQDRFLMELGALLDRALGEAARTGGTVTLSRLFRVELRRNQALPYPAAPSGWKP